MAAKRNDRDVVEAPVLTDNPCRVVSFYDEAVARDPLVRFWDVLAKKFEGEIEFQFSWWKYPFLCDVVMARVAAADAQKADILIFARRGGGEVPEGLRSFNDLWEGRRENDRGLLLAVFDQSLGLQGGSIPLQVHLREVAKRANMEYWLQFFFGPVAGVGESLEGLMQRADHVSPLLEEILQRARLPASHWGINE